LPLKEGNSRIGDKYKIFVYGRIDAGFGNYSCRSSVRLNYIMEQLRKDRKKRHEKFFLERFLFSNPDINCSDIIDTETPDFIIISNDEKIGIEITELVNTPEKKNEPFPVQKDSLEKSIVKEAEKQFKKQNLGPALNVSFWFKDSLRCRRHEIAYLGNELKKLVSKNIKHKNLNESFLFRLYEDIPEYLISCKISYHPKIKQSIWYNTKAKSLPNPTESMIYELIKKKEENIDNYLKKAPKVYLLIVEGTPPYSWFDSFNNIKSLKLRTKFNKVYIYRNLDDETICLKK